MSWDVLKAEFEQIKVVYKTTLQPVDTRTFLKHIICNKAAFPCMRVLLRCALRKMLLLSNHSPN